MKKLAAIVTAFILILSSFMLAACDLGDTSGGETQADSTSDTTVDSESNTVTDAVENNGGNNGGDNSGDDGVKEISTEGGTLVENLDGKTPYRLYCDISTMMNECVEGEQQIILKGSASSDEFELKLSASSGYYSLDDGRQEGWHIGGNELYGRDGNNCESSKISFYEFKSSLIDLFNHFWYVELSEEDFNGVELFKTPEGLYYFTVKQTVDGTEQAVTYFFGANGAVRQFQGAVGGKTVALCAFTWGDVPAISLPDDWQSPSDGNGNSSDSGNADKGDAVGPVVGPDGGAEEIPPSNPYKPSEDSDSAYIEPEAYEFYSLISKESNDERIPKNVSQDDFSYLKVYDDGTGNANVMEFKLKSDPGRMYTIRLDSNNNIISIT